MKRSYLFSVILTILIGCTSVPYAPEIPKGWRHLNVGPFAISIPPTWNYDAPNRQEDSFVGQIMGPNLELSFDCSDMGYANHLISADDANFKNYNIKIDTTDKYIVKTIWPKATGNGTTGIYINSRTSTFNFQMNGHNLSVQNENLALKAFKTITFKQ